MKITAQRETFRLAETFSISRGSKTEAEVITVTLEAGGVAGRGECVPYGRYGESLDSVRAEIEGYSGPMTHEAFAAHLPAGAARNALDAALWDWRAKRAGCRIWTLAGLEPPRPLITAFTITLNSPERMRAAAARHAERPILKIKLGTPGDMPRLEAVRAGAPAARIIVDANEGWDAEIYRDLAPHLRRLGVEMVEQPLPAGADAALSEMPRPVPVCADESCHTREDLAGLTGRYDLVNVKLDKAGGLTEALALCDAARQQGFGVMVGCMVGSSLAMAPAVLAAQAAAVTDLDGPLLLAEDRSVPLRYDAQGVHPPEAALWG